MAEKYSLKDINKIQKKSIFVDANVLIYLFWSTGATNSRHWENRYASIFRGLLRQDNALFVDFLVISEVINRILRIEYQKLGLSMKFKDFRDSHDGKKTLNDIHIVINSNILSRFNVIGKNFTKQDIENFLTVDKLDFVDKGTVSLCKENSLILLTNDKDFKNSDLDILTENPLILNKS